MIALLLTITVLGADGGSLDSYRACPEDAPLAVKVDGGYFVPELRMQRTACRLASCEAERDGLLKEEPGGPGWKAWAIGLSLAFGAGLAVAAMLSRR